MTAFSLQAPGGGFISNEDVDRVIDMLKSSFPHDNPDKVISLMMIAAAVAAKSCGANEEIFMSNAQSIFRRAQQDRHIRLCGK